MKVLKIEMNIYKEDITDMTEELQDILLAKFITTIEENGCLVYMFSGIKDDSDLDREEGDNNEAKSSKD